MGMVNGPKTDFWLSFRYPTITIHRGNAASPLGQTVLDSDDFKTEFQKLADVINSEAGRLNVILPENEVWIGTFEAPVNAGIKQTALAQAAEFFGVQPKAVMLATDKPNLDGAVTIAATRRSNIAETREFLAQFGLSVHSVVYDLNGKALGFTGRFASLLPAFSTHRRPIVFGIGSAVAASLLAVILFSSQDGGDQGFIPAAGQADGPDFVVRAEATPEFQAAPLARPEASTQRVTQANTAGTEQQPPIARIASPKAPDMPVVMISTRNVPGLNATSAISQDSYPAALPDMSTEIGLDAADLKELAAGAQIDKIGTDLAATTLPRGQSDPENPARATPSQSEPLPPSPLPRPNIGDQTRAEQINAIVLAAARLDTDPTPLSFDQLAPRARPAEIARIAEDRAAHTGLHSGDYSLVGIFGTKSNRRAILRLPNGSFKKVKSGDRVNGIRVAVVGERSIKLRSTSGDVTLRLP